MEWDFVNEISNKFMHILILIFTIGFFSLQAQTGKQMALLYLIGILILFFVIEYLRLDLNIHLPFLDYFIRPHEKDRLGHAVIFLAAAIICLAVYNPIIALSALLMTTFGDMAAAIFGKRFGATLIFKNKTIVGFASGLVTNIIIALIIVFVTATNIYIILTMAFVAAIVEMVVDELDDNLLVPIIAGFVGQILIILL